MSLTASFLLYVIAPSVLVVLAACLVIGKGER
jgi:hypothetical protein